MKAKHQQEAKAINIGKKAWVSFCVVLLGVMVSAIAIVDSTHQSRLLLNELNQLENQRNELQITWNQLSLEQSSLVSQGRVEDLAITVLGMEMPVMEDVVVIHRD